ncbi:hypothetical protein XELAEV_18046119mg [Xenopus laevis]|uniref:SprT-like domain-containing protein n=1 Tax=Xenopus laevis TaxID=8355 RepID=A0A974BSE5_XENLA|nr:hypothetical protein XELAEV_18046119mg [Xenopus laevis]
MKIYRHPLLVACVGIFAGIKTNFDTGDNSDADDKFPSLHNSVIPLFKVGLGRWDTGKKPGGLPALVDHGRNLPITSGDHSRFLGCGRKPEHLEEPHEVIGEHTLINSYFKQKVKEKKKTQVDGHQKRTWLALSSKHASPKKTTLNTNYRSNFHSSNSDPNDPYLYGSLSIVDPRWETIDPNPDLQALYREFNGTFFAGILPQIEVKWSSKLTRYCKSLRNPDFFHLQEGGNCARCEVQLSKPILSLRPRKDTVETLLHEMIHVFLCVTKMDDEHDQHGLEFEQMMTSINMATGANISIYHTYQQEVEILKKHQWECNGPCGKIVKRACNRVPSCKERWFREHEQKCGGDFIKTSEPEGPARKKRRS